MDKLVDTAVGTVHGVKEATQSVIDTAKDKLPRIGGERLAPVGVVLDEATGRYRDSETGQFVKREEAMKVLGGAAVTRAMKPTTSRQPDGATGTKTDQNRYSTRQHQNRRAQLEAIDAERYRAWNEQLTLNAEQQVLRSQAKREGVESERMQAWVEQRTEGWSLDKAHEQALHDRKMRQFDSAKASLYSGPAQARLAFAVAERIRKAREDFSRHMSEGELDDETFIQGALQISEREDRLQEMLIKYDKEISQDQQDFIIDYSGGAYDELLEKESHEVGPARIKNSDDTGAKAKEAATHTNGEAISVDQDAVVHDEEKSQPDDVGMGDISQSWSSWPGIDESQTGAGGAARNGGEGLTSSSEPDDGSAWGPDAEAYRNLEEAWTGLGEKEAIAAELMELDPDLYMRYAKARKAFVIGEANALGAGLPAPGEKASWIKRFRNRLPGRFKKSYEQPDQDMESFDSVYGQALSTVIQGYEAMAPKDEFKFRKDLESNAASQIACDISKMKFEATKDGQPSRRRQALMLGGYAVAAAAAGAVTAIVEKRLKGGEHWWYYAVAGGFGALAGAAAAKGYRPSEDEHSIETNAAAARKAVIDKYSKGSLDSLGNKAIAIEGAKTVTKKEKRKTRVRYLGAAAVGAAAGVGGHYLVDVGWPWLASLREAGVENPQVQDSAADLTAEAFDPLDTDHSGTVEPGVDIPDRNGDGVINTDDLFDPLDTSRDGVVDGQDIPDRNGDGRITADDLYDPLDTNHDGRINEMDIPDRNNDGVIDVDDFYDPLDTNHDGRTDGQDVPDINGDEVIDINDVPQYPDNETAPQAQEQAPAASPEAPVVEAGQDIYVESGSGINNEVDQYLNSTSNIDLDPEQLNTMYNDLFGPGGEYRPEDVFGGDINFYEMPNGQVGIKTVGPATITPLGQDVINEWVAEKVYGN